MSDWKREAAKVRALRRLAKEFPDRFGVLFAEEKAHAGVQEARPSAPIFWTTGQIEDLRRFACLGAESCAEQLGRTVASVKWKARQLRISLRREGVRGGLLLGQPRHVSFRETALWQLREDSRAGRISIERANRRLRLIDKGRPCPECWARPQEVETTGLCEDCHLKRLAQVHAMEPARVEAQRELDRERQRKHRRKEPALEVVR